MKKGWRMTVTVRQVARARYRARQRGLPADLDWNEWCKTLQDFGGVCAYCQCRSARTIDHFIPLALGGGSSINNCVPCCSICNLLKGSLHPSNFYLVPHETIKHIETYLWNRRLGYSVDELKPFFQEMIQGEEKNMLTYEEQANEKTSQSEEEALASGERVSVLKNRERVALQMSRSSSAHDPYAPSYQITAHLTVEECVALANRLLTVSLPLLRVKAAPENQKLQESWSEEAWSSR